MDSVSESRLSDVHPALADKIRSLASILQTDSNIAIRVVQALRSWNEQEALYAQGRTAPGKIVTNCHGGYSYHNFGLAVDCVPDLDSTDNVFTPDWNPAHPVWAKMVEVAQTLGLTCGATWRTFKDYPHFQLNGRFPVGAPDGEVRQLFADGGMSAVWAEAEI